MLKQLKQLLTFTLFILALATTSQALSMNAESKKKADAKRQDIQNSFERALEVYGLACQQIEEDIQNPKISLEGLEGCFQNLIAKLDNLSQKAVALNMPAITKKANSIKSEASANLLYVMELIEEA